MIEIVLPRGIYSNFYTHLFKTITNFWPDLFTKQSKDLQSAV